MNNKARLILKVGSVALLVFGFFAYGLYKSKSFIAGPELVVKNPTTGSALPQPATEVAGKVSNVAAVFLNGNQIYTNDKGEFKENLLLAKGYNIIEVRANDKFGRIVKETREIMVR